MYATNISFYHSKKAFYNWYITSIPPTAIPERALASLWSWPTTCQNHYSRGMLQKRVVLQSRGTQPCFCRFCRKVFVFARGSSGASCRRKPGEPENQTRGQGVPSAGGGNRAFRQRDLKVRSSANPWQGVGRNRARKAVHMCHVEKFMVMDPLEKMLLTAAKKGLVHRPRAVSLAGPGHCLE